MLVVMPETLCFISLSKVNNFDGIGHGIVVRMTDQGIHKAGAGETSIDALIRELGEEQNISVRPRRSD